jgi:hypothetical protein
MSGGELPSGHQSLVDASHMHGLPDLPRLQACNEIGNRDKFDP